MPFLMINEVPRYECLLRAASEFPDLDPSASEAFLQLLRTSDEAIRVVGSELGKHALSKGRFFVLMALWTQSRRAADPSSHPCTLTPAALAERAGVTRATMSGLIGTLLKDGLVTRVPHKDDRRMTCVELTDRARQVLKEMLPEHFRDMAWLMQNLTEAERKTLIALLTKIQQRAAERPTPPMSDDPECSRENAAR